MFESEIYTSSFDELLSDTTRHLRDIDKRSLGSGDYHLLDVIVVLQVRLCRFTSPISSFVELVCDKLFERLSDSHTRRRLHTVQLSFRDQSLDRLLSFHHSVRDRSHGLGVDDRVSDTDTESKVQQPVVDHPLNCREEVSSDNVALLSEDDVDQTIVRATSHVLDDGTVDELSVIDQHILVCHIDGRWLLVVLGGDVDALRDAH